MSDTPETDDELNYNAFGFYTMGGLPTDAVCVDFARNLERERDRYQEQADALVDRLGVTREKMFDAERERDSAIKNASNNLHHYVKANLRVEEIKSERDEAVRACEIWQDGHSRIVEDRDYWRAEAERWRDLKMS